MKKFFIVFSVALLLVGCVDSSNKENTNIIFKEELAKIDEIGEAAQKKLPDEVLISDVEKVFNEIFEYAIFEDSSVEYGEVTQGMGADGNGGRVFCSKLPVNVKFSGTEASIEKFIEFFEGFENVVSFGEFDISTLEGGKYEVNTIITFLSKDSGGTLAEGKKEYTIKKNEIAKKEVEEPGVRNFDVSMILRPSNSDSSAISLGVKSENNSVVYSDENVKKDVYISFNNNGNKYFCEYAIGNNKTEKAEIKPNGDILVDVLSCEVEELNDNISADLHVSNNSNKKVSFVIYDDYDKRVNISEKAGNVEVSRK